MDLISVGVRCTSYCLLGAIICRGFQARLWRVYCFFYTYVTYVSISSAALFCLSFRSLRTYVYAYWTAELLSVLLGTTVVWEAYDAALGNYPGVRRIARLLIGSVLLVVAAKFAVDAALRPIGALFPTIIDVEKELRFIQAILLVAILSLISYYHVPMNRNVRYLLFGYSFFIGAVVITLTMQSALGASFLKWWRTIQPITYLASLAMWCVGLWSRSAEPAVSPRLERDYERVSRETARALMRVRTFLGEALRQ